MRETAPIHEHNFTVSGGNTTARFALSAQYLNQDGMYKVMDNGFERLTVRANTTVNLNKDIMMFVDMFVGRDTQRQPETMNKTILDYIYLAPPTRPFWTTSISRRRRSSRNIPARRDRSPDTTTTASISSG